jgi:hypothetical protein
VAFSQYVKKLWCKHKHMKIQQHPRMQNIMVDDEVYSYPLQLYARVVEVFPAAVCVKIGILSINGTLEFILSPQLWRADDIENLSQCRYCGSREELEMELGTGIPFRICKYCRSSPPQRRHPPRGWW